MKYKLRTYYTNNIRGWFIQCTLLPSITITHNRQNFIETGVYGKAWTLSFEFLFWSFGVTLYQDYE